MKNTAYLVDASIYIFRAYFSMPDAWHTADGYPVNALYGYVLFWLKFLQQTRPGYVVAAYDESLGSCFRNELFPDYKMSRVLPDPELAFQLEACKGFTDIMGIASPASDTYEADDILATLAQVARKRGDAVVVVSRDKDLSQLVCNPEDRFWDFAADKQLDTQGVKQQFGVLPSQLPDFLALVGDAIDDIPGVPGVGAKTAAALLQQFGSLEGIFSNLTAIPQSRLRGARSLAEKLPAYRAQIELSRRLTTLHTRVPLSRSVRAMHWKPPPLAEVCYYLREFGLDGRLRRQLEAVDWWV